MSKYSEEMVILFIATLVILVTLVVLFFLVPGTVNPSQEEAYGPFEMGTALPPIGAFTKSAVGTLRVFYYIESLPRTNTAYLDKTPSPSFNSETNTYGICEVNDTTNCAHLGFTKLLTITNSFFIEVLQAPDASRPGLPKTQMVIQTRKNVSGTNKLYLETFTLPEFPLQKWVMLTIVRNGNRFNVFYDDKLVFSKNTTYIPYIEDGGGVFSDATVKGKVKNVLQVSEAFSLAKVRADFAINADTRGEPLEYLFTKMNYTLCPSGECFSGPKIRPANPLVEWNSDVM